MFLSWLAVVLGAALAVVVIVAGYPLVGALIAVAAVARAVFLLRGRSRREEHRRRHRGYSDPG